MHACSSSFRLFVFVCVFLCVVACVGIRFVWSRLGLPLMESSATENAYTWLEAFLSSPSQLHVAGPVCGDDSRGPFLRGAARLALPGERRQQRTCATQSKRTSVTVTANRK